MSDIRPHGNRFKDLLGLRFGRLRVIEFHGRDSIGRSMWFCECSCGEQKVVASRHLVNGVTVSCGCLRNKRSAENGKNSGHKISGENHYRYRSDLSDDERNRLRWLPEWHKWRRFVYERDNYTCDICNSRGSSLQAHHLYSWRDHPNKRFDIDNGVTLCKKCHLDFHSYMGGVHVPCTPKDYKSYKRYLDRKSSELEREERE